MRPSTLHAQEEQPLTAPAHDVDITYRIAQPGLPVIIERRRWLASRHLRRVDGPDNSTSIFDPCIDWSWMDDTEVHIACLTPDGVLLRLVIDGRIVAEARSVLYAPQPP